MKFILVSLILLLIVIVVAALIYFFVLRIAGEEVTSQILFRDVYEDLSAIEQFYKSKSDSESYWASQILANIRQDLKLLERGKD